MFDSFKFKAAKLKKKLNSFKLGRKKSKGEIEAKGDIEANVQPHCISCDCQVYSSWSNPCGHYYCPECLSEMANLALKDKALIPLRCCRQPLSQNNLVQVLNAYDLAKYENLQKSPTLVSRFILDQDYRSTVRKNGWKLCPSCGAGIEKIDGCHHVICPCGRDFNYDLKQAALYYVVKLGVAFGGILLIIFAIAFSPILVVVHYCWTDKPFKIVKNCAEFIHDFFRAD